MLASRHHCASLLLDGQEGRDLRHGARRSMRPSSRLPGCTHALHALDAARVADDQFIPQRVAPTACDASTARGGTTAAAIRARARTSPNARATAGAYWATALLPVALRSKPMPSRVGAVVVDRSPVGARAAGDPGSGTVVMSAPHQVMQAERRHVVHHRFARTHHHADDRSRRRRRRSRMSFASSLRAIARA